MIIIAAISCAIYSVLFAMTIPIYRAKGWRKMTHYVWCLIGSIILVALILNGNGLDPDKRSISEDFGIGVVIPFSVYMLVTAIHQEKYNKHKDKIEAWMDEQIEAMLPVPDKELAKIRRTMNYPDWMTDESILKNPLHRKELTRRWKIKKKQEMYDPFLWKKFKDE